jgi:hypothetical protein
MSVLFDGRRFMGHNGPKKGVKQFCHGGLLQVALTGNAVLFDLLMAFWHVMVNSFFCF